MAGRDSYEVAVGDTVEVSVYRNSWSNAVVVKIGPKYVHAQVGGKWHSQVYKFRRDDQYGEYGSFRTLAQAEESRRKEDAYRRLRNAGVALDSYPVRYTTDQLVALADFVDNLRAGGGESWPVDGQSSPTKTAETRRHLMGGEP